MFCKSSLTPRNKFSEATGTEQYTGTIKLWLPLQQRSSDSKPPQLPLCLGWHDIGAFTWYPKDHTGLLTLSYAGFVGHSAAGGNGIIFLSCRWQDSEYTQREKVPLVQSHVSEQLHISARHGWVWEPWQAKRLSVYFKVVICGHSESWPWALATKCMKNSEILKAKSSVHQVKECY